MTGFDDIYNSVERIGGIGSSNSQINISRNKNQSEFGVRRFHAIERSNSRLSNMSPVVGEHSFKSVIENSIQRPVVKTTISARRMPPLPRTKKLYLN